MTVAWRPTTQPCTTAQDQSGPAGAAWAASPKAVFLSTFFADYSTGSGPGTVSLAIDHANRVILAGATRSSDFPATKGAVKGSLTGGEDLFVAVFDPELKTLVAATLLGGSGDETRCAVALDANDDVYLSGLTTSKDFPEGAAMLDRTSGEAAARTFVLKLSSDLSKVLSSAVLATEPTPSASAPRILYDVRRERVILAGVTASKGFPTTLGAFQVANAKGQAKKFIAILDPGLTKIMAATLLGGNAEPEWSVTSLLTDRAGHVFVGGHTASPDYPTTAGAVKPSATLDGTHGVISKLSPDLSRLAASTFIGESGNDFVYALALDRSENVVFAGHVGDAMPTTPRAYLRTNRGNADVANIGILSNDLSKLLASTFVCGGGEGQWSGGFSMFTHLSVDRTGSIFASGMSEVPYFPTTPGVYDDTPNGGRDLVIVKMTADLSLLTASTFLGGSGYESFHAMTLDQTGRVVVAGPTPSRDYPTSAGAYQTSLSGRGAYYVTTLDADLTGIRQLPVHRAASLGDVVRLAALMEKDTSLMTALDRYRRAPLHWAARFGRLDAVAWLLRRSADANACDGDGNTPLHLAVLGRHGTAVQRLVVSGADVSRANMAGDTPLHLAALVGDDDVVRFLIDRHANPNLRNKQGNTALHRAVFSQHRGATAILLDGGADVSIKNESGDAPLHLAAITTRGAEAMELLLKAGAPINALNGKKQTPLHCAAGYFRESEALALLRAGPAVNLQDEDGQTPLHVAVRKSFVRVVRELLEKSANPTIVDKNGKSPIDLAREAKNPELLALLEKTAAERRRCLGTAEVNVRVALVAAGQNLCGLLEDPAIQETIDCILYNLSQAAKGWLKPLFVELEKRLEIMGQRPVEDGSFRLPTAVDPARSWLGAFHSSQGRKKGPMPPSALRSRRRAWGDTSTSRVV